MKMHPFETAGMGVGPYEFVQVYDLGEALDPNTAANFGNMNGKLKGAPELVSGMGTCSCCGHGIMVICVVKDAEGKLYGVGSDCVEKAGDESLGEKAKIAVAKRRKVNAAKRRQDKAEAKRKEWLSRLDKATGKTMGQLQEEERQRQIKANEEFLQKRKDRAEKYQPIAKWAGNDSFLQSLANQLQNGPLSQRQAYYLARAYVRGPGAAEEREKMIREWTE